MRAFVFIFDGGTILKRVSTYCKRVHDVRCVPKNCRSFVSSPSSESEKLSAAPLVLDELDQIEFSAGNYWGDKRLQRKFFDKIANEQLKLKSWEDWYSVSRSAVLKLGATALLNSYYGGSLIRALVTLYPERGWELWRFSTVPAGYWKDIANQRYFFDLLGKKLNIVQFEDWYAVSQKEVYQRGGSGLINSYYGGSLLRALAAVYPQHSWDPNGWRHVRLASNGLKGQIKLLNVVQSMFHKNEVFVDFILDHKGEKYELDVAIPSLSLAFEYQGQHHYVTNFYGDDESLKRQQSFDNLKSAACNAAKFTLIEVPYWWDGRRESLRATIFISRPDIVPPPKDGEKPIPSIIEYREYSKKNKSKRRGKEL